MSTGPGDDDARLVSASLRGDRTAFGAIMSRNNSRLHRVAYAILRNQLDAEEAMQEAYLNAFRSLRSFNGTSSLSTWLTSIGVNESLGRLRRRRATEESTEAAAVMVAEGDDAVFDPEQHAAREEIRLILEALIDQLPKPFQEVFKLRAFEHLSVEETAARRRIPQATVKTRYHRAKRQLAEALGPEFGTILHDGFPFAGERCRLFTDQVLDRLTGSIACLSKIDPAKWLSIAVGPWFPVGIACFCSLAA